MSDENVVSALSGAEIKADLRAKFSRALDYSCDLRDTDAYTRGYSAEVDIRIKLHDSETVSYNTSFTVQPKVEIPETTVPIEIEEKIVVEQEENLKTVRNRIKDAELEMPQESSGLEESQIPIRNKRKYTRRNAIDPADYAHTTGEAVEIEPSF
jgi:hypothetical protein